MTPQRLTTAERLTALETTAQNTHDLIKDMHSRLFGNGHSGEIEKLDHRVRVLEAFRWRLRGMFAAGGVVGAAAGAIGGIVVHWLKK